MVWGLGEKDSRLPDLFSSLLLKLCNANGRRFFFGLFGLSKTTKIFIILEFLLDLQEFLIRQNGILFLPVLLNDLSMQSNHGVSLHLSVRLSAMPNPILKNSKIIH